MGALPIPHKKSKSGFDFDKELSSMDAVNAMMMDDVISEMDDGSAHHNNNIDDNDKPIKAAKTQNVVCALEELILLIPKLI